MTPKCPHCDKPLTSVNLAEVDASAPFGGTTWRGVVYSCRLCHKAISIGLDPITLKNDTVREIAALLRQR